MRSVTDPAGVRAGPSETRAPRALVTGGLRGIGLATCRALLADGYDVTAVSRSSADAIAATDRVAS
jgi:NAD(P)-dependent dehydrogenase (short-subunit alcohol dehydrogenase family)